MGWRKYSVYVMLILLLGFGAYLIVQNPNADASAAHPSTTVAQNNFADDSSKLLISGEAVYKKYCQNCHGSFKSHDGPWLIFHGLDSRWPDKKELAAYIKNPEQVRKKNVYAKDLPKKWGAVMPGFPKLKDDEITSVLAYILAKVKE